MWSYQTCFLIPRTNSPYNSFTTQHSLVSSITACHGHWARRFDTTTETSRQTDRQVLCLYSCSCSQIGLSPPKRFPTDNTQRGSWRYKPLQYVQSCHITYHSTQLQRTYICCSVSKPNSNPWQDVQNLPFHSTPFQPVSYAHRLISASIHQSIRPSCKLLQERCAAVRRDQHLLASCGHHRDFVKLPLSVRPGFSDRSDPAIVVRSGDLFLIVTAYLPASSYPAAITSSLGPSSGYSHRVRLQRHHQAASICINTSTHCAAPAPSPPVDHFFSCTRQ